MSDNRDLDGILQRLDRTLFDDPDHWILQRLCDLTQSLESGFQDYEIAPLTHRLYAFFWSDFCDWYVEASKAKLQASAALRDNCLAIQDLVIRQFLQLAHPVIPHITEELWQALGYAQPQTYIHQARLSPAQALIQSLNPDASAVERVAQLQALISQGRALKAQYRLASKRDVVVYYTAEAQAQAILEQNQGLINRLAGFKSCTALGTNMASGMPATVTPLATLYLDLSSSLDLVAESSRLNKDLAKLEQQVSSGEKKLSNEKFVKSAPEKVVEGARKQLAEARAKRDETKRLIESFQQNSAPLKSES
jgi:valyl-tRNA synthetase